MFDYQERCWASGDGLSLFARDYATGGGSTALPVVCLHGLTRNSRDFEDVAPLLARLGRRVLVPDMRGRGLSDWDPEPARYAPRTYVQDVLALLETLGIDRAVFIGTSMGGIITMAMADSAPERIAAAVVNDVGPVVAPEGIARIKSYVGGTSAIADWTGAREYVRLTNQAAFPDFVSEDWDRFARRLFREVDGVPRLDYDPGIALQLRRDLYKAPDAEAWDLFRILATGRPTLLIRGDLSDLLSPEIAARMREVAPEMQQVDVARVGHAPMLTEPEAVQALRSFLAQVP
jgi:pimeloyl-ACP methyl ester carboxylesterase